MDVQIAALADCANVAAGDKLNVMGVFDTIQVPIFPAVHAFMVLALRLRYEYEDGGKGHTLTISLQDEDGREHLRAESKVQVSVIKPGVRLHSNHILNFAQMGFGKPGNYTFHVMWDGEFKGKVNLSVVSLATG